MHRCCEGTERAHLILHLLSEPVHLSPGVAIYDRLGDGQRRVQIAERLEEQGRRAG